MKNKNAIILMGIVLLLGALLNVGCKREKKVEIEVSGISPEKKLAGAEFTLTVRGNHFTTASVIRFNGKELPTTQYISATELQASLTSAETGITGEGTEKSVPVGVTDKSDPNSPNSSNTVYLTLQYQPETTLPILVQDKPITIQASEYGNVKLLSTDDDALYLIWTEQSGSLSATPPTDSAEVKPNAYAYSYMMRRSDNFGETWSEMMQIQPYDFIYSARDNSILYATHMQNNVITFYYSTDKGNTWSQKELATLEGREYGNSYRFLPNENNNNLLLVYEETDPNSYVCTITVKRSTDWGANWETISSGEIVTDFFDYNFQWMAVNEANDICLGYYYHYGRYGVTGTLLSTDGGATFSELGKGFHDALNPVLKNDGTIYLAYGNMPLPYMRELTFYKGEEYGSTMVNVTSFAEMSPYVADMILHPSTNIFLLSTDYILHSFDDGATWSEAKTYHTEHNITETHFTKAPNNTIFITFNTPEGIYMSKISNI